VLYRRRDEASGPDAPEAVAFRQAYSNDTRIRFVGVWIPSAPLGSHSAASR
jgi:hypothetical protein